MHHEDTEARNNYEFEVETRAEYAALMAEVMRDRAVREAYARGPCTIWCKGGRLDGTKGPAGPGTIWCRAGLDRVWREFEWAVFWLAVGLMLGFVAGVAAYEKSLMR